MGRVVGEGLYKQMISEIKNMVIRKRILRAIPDAIYLSILYRVKIGRQLNLKKPITYTEKLQWLKLNNRQSILTTLVYKYKVREYVKKQIGEEYLIPLIGGPWKGVEDIPVDVLPEAFVLKTTHDSGGVVICRDKGSLDWNKAKKKLKCSLDTNFFWRYREWPYKNVDPFIIAEKYMVDESDYELKDYKFFVFYGEVKALFIATDRMAETDTCFDFFDRDFNHLPIINGHPNSSHRINKPDKFEEMIELAEILGKGFPHVRIDLYNISGKIYFGEYTFFHFSGITPFEPDEWDYKFGEWLNIVDK